MLPIGLMFCYNCGKKTEAASLTGPAAFLSQHRKSAGAASVQILAHMSSGTLPTVGDGAVFCSQKSNSTSRFFDRHQPDSPICGLLLRFVSAVGLVWETPVLASRPVSWLRSGRCVRAVKADLVARGCYDVGHIAHTERRL